MTKAVGFTKAELERYRAFFESVGERVGGVEKHPGGVVRLLTASQAAGAAYDPERVGTGWEDFLGSAE